MRAVRNHSTICGIPFLSPPPPSPPRCVGLAGKLGCCACPLPLCYRPVLGKGTWRAGRDIDQLAGARNQFWTSCRVLPATVQRAAVPYCPPTDPRDRGNGRTGQLSCCCLSTAVATPNPASRHAPMGARQALGERGVSTGSVAF